MKPKAHNARENAPATPFPSAWKALAAPPDGAKETTPETDAAELQIISDDSPKGCPTGTVPIDFARTLELQRNALRRELDYANSYVIPEKDKYGRYWHDLAQERIAQLAQAQRERDEACKVITDLRLGPPGGKPISDELKASLNEMSEQAYERASLKGNLERSAATQELEGLRAALVEKTIEADTMRQHHANAEALLTARTKETPRHD